MGLSFVLNPFTNELSPVNNISNLKIGNIVTVKDLNNLPTPVGGVITLEPLTAYLFCGNIDLQGNRILSTGVNSIIGSTSESSFLTSTGLGIGVPLITATNTLPIQEITIHNVDTAVVVNGASDTALDWIGVNFVNVPNVGLINTASNFIYIRGAFLNSKGLRFDGTINTIGFTDSLFSIDSAAGAVFKTEDTLTINARFRVSDCSIIVGNLSTGIDFSDLTTVNTESYILRNVNFAGNGTYLVGVDYQGNKSLFKENRGIKNTARIINYYMSGNVIPTIITAIGQAVKVAGNTSYNINLTQKFEHTDNRATYVGEIKTFFNVFACASIISGNNNIIGLYVALNGVVLPESEMYATTNAGGRAESISIQTIVELEKNDYIEIWVENETAIINVTAEYLNVIIEGLS